MPASTLSPLTGNSIRQIAAYYSSIDPEKNERLSWLTYSGRFTHISGHPSAVGQVQDRESLPVEDRRSTTVPCNQPVPVFGVEVLQLQVQVLKIST